MTDWTVLIETIVGGVAVLVIGGVGGALWHSTLKTASGLVKVSRQKYLERVLIESTGVQTQEIFVLAPGLKSGAEDTRLAKIQDAWKEVARRGTVKVLSENTDQNLRAACELHDRGVLVRLTNDLDVTSFSFHIFRHDTGTWVILNEKAGATDRPVVFNSSALDGMLVRSFDRLWNMKTARTVPDILAARIEGMTSFPRSMKLYFDNFNAVIQMYSVGERLKREVRRRCALMAFAQCIFIVGLPGVGKSTLKDILSKKLQSMGQKVEAITDYPYLYEGFIADLTANRATRYAADPERGLHVLDSEVMSNAIGRLNTQAVRALSEGRVCLIEFARSNLAQSLAQFDASVRSRSQLIYLAASEKVRRTRITGRIRPPEPFVEGFDEAYKVGLQVSDKHPISNEVLDSLYAKDDVEAVRTSSQWERRFHWINTEDEARTVDALEPRVEQFLIDVENRFWQGFN
jgi:deoxyadenosine/deoxycytidine kinase